MKHIKEISDIKLSPSSSVGIIEDIHDIENSHFL